jgi:hypothetical protein
VKPEFEKITKEVNILIKKAKNIRRYNYIGLDIEPGSAHYGSAH